MIASLAALALAAGTPGADTTGAGAAGRRWEDEIVYVVIVQKFCNGELSNDVMARRFGADRAQYEGGLWGGDIAGVDSKLDYLARLGATALLLYPIIQNDQNPVGKYLAPGYRPKVYFKVDENFGDITELARFVGHAHARGIKVILDLPLGMPGFEHPHLTDPTKRDWFGPPTAYGMRQWDTANPEVADYLISIGKFWKAQSGCDGFRLDSAHLHPATFWSSFVRQLKGDDAPRPFVILAEVPLHPKRIAEMCSASGFDSAYDFSAGTARNAFGKGIGVEGLPFVLGEGTSTYASPRSMVAQIDNYEDPDFLSSASEPRRERMRLAMTYLLTLDRVPLIYTGDEVALSYRNTGELFRQDPARDPLFEHTRRLIALRQAEPALRRGDRRDAHCERGVYAFVRQLGPQRILVILNSSGERRDVRFPVSGTLWGECELLDLMSGSIAKAAGDEFPLAVEPFEGRVLRLAPPASR